MLRICACCGRPMDARNKSEKWCFPCRRYYDKKPPIRKETRECPVCGDWFVPVNDKMIYCTDTCKRSECARRYKEKQKEKTAERKKKEKAKRDELKKIKTKWWQDYMKSDRLGKDTMLARRFGFASYAHMVAAIDAGKASREDMEKKAMQQEREKYESKTIQEQEKHEIV